VARRWSVARLAPVEPVLRRGVGPGVGRLRLVLRRPRFPGDRPRQARREGRREDLAQHGPHRLRRRIRRGGSRHLGEDRPRVELGRDAVQRRAEGRLPGVELAQRVGAAIAGQGRGVEVDRAEARDSDDLRRDAVGERPADEQVGRQRGDDRRQPLRARGDDDLLLRRAGGDRLAVQRAPAGGRAGGGHQERDRGAVLRRPGDRHGVGVRPDMEGDDLETLCGTTHRRVHAALLLARSPRAADRVDCPFIRRGRAGSLSPRRARGRRPGRSRRGGSSRGG